jgi:putative holliday junction resolvase
MSTAHRKILGLDYGDKRIGLALAEEGSIALPYKILENKSQASLLVALTEIIAAESISLIVVGLPYSLSGQMNERLRLTQDFVAWLKTKVPLEIFTVDERFTSKMFLKMGVKEDIDKHSAAAILDSFLSQDHV